MKLKDFDNVFDGDIYIAPWENADKNIIQAVPIGNLLRGICFIMDLTVRKIEINFDTLGAVVFVDILKEVMPAIIAYNGNLYITLEKDEQ